MARHVSLDEARRQTLSEWRSWADQRIPGDQVRGRSHALQFYSFLQTDRAPLLQSFGSVADSAMIHGWLFRNGDVLD